MATTEAVDDRQLADARAEVNRLARIASAPRDLRAAQAREKHLVAARSREAALDLARNADPAYDRKLADAVGAELTARRQVETLRAARIAAARQTPQTIEDERGRLFFGPNRQGLAGALLLPAPTLELRIAEDVWKGARLRLQRLEQWPLRLVQAARVRAAVAKRDRTAPTWQQAVRDNYERRQRARGRSQ